MFPSLCIFLSFRSFIYYNENSCIIILYSSKVNPGIRHLSIPLKYFSNNFCFFNTNTKTILPTLHHFTFPYNIYSVYRYILFHNIFEKKNLPTSNMQKCRLKISNPFLHLFSNNTILNFNSMHNFRTNFNFYFKILFKFD